MESNRGIINSCTPYKFTHTSITTEVSSDLGSQNIRSIFKESLHKIKLLKFKYLCSSQSHFMVSLKDFAIDSILIFQYNDNSLLILSLNSKLYVCLTYQELSNSCKSYIINQSQDLSFIIFQLISGLI
ncbi:hypothetical protein ABPG74_016222 [Tetrahymena malaccensis]